MTTTRPESQNAVLGHGGRSTVPSSSEAQDFVCYECADGLHAFCLGVPCHCPCPVATSSESEMPSEWEARAVALEAKIEQAELIWEAMTAANAHLRCCLQETADALELVRKDNERLRERVRVLESIS